MTQDAQTAAPGVSVEVMAFRKKPVVITAVQMTKEVAAAYLFEKKPLPDGVEFASASHNNGKINNFHAYIETLEGRMAVSIGDWIITGVKGERYPCKPDIFEMTYESAAPPPPAGELQGVSEAEVQAAIAIVEDSSSNGFVPIKAMRRALESFAASRPAAPVAAVDAELAAARNAIKLIAEDGWLCCGPEGLSEAQQACLDEYKKFNPATGEGAQS